MTIPNTTKALRYSEFGDPMETLKLETIPLAPPENDEVTVRVLAAPINPADFGRINGSYGTLATLPATGGLEGVGEVVSCGRHAERFPPGKSHSRGVPEDFSIGDREYGCRFRKPSPISRGSDS